MKRWLSIGVLVLVLTAALAGTALAQGATPPAATDVYPCGLTVGATPWGGGVRGGVAGRGMPDWAGADEAVQKLLGMTAEQLQAERLAGKSLVDIAAARGVNEEALIAAIVESHKATLAQLVADGKLTQAQADAMALRMQEQVKVMVERTSVGPAWRTQPSQPAQGQGVAPMSRGGRGGMMGGRWNGAAR